jgi:hypothetical protein
MSTVMGDASMVVVEEMRQRGPTTREKHVRYLSTGKCNRANSDQQSNLFTFHVLMTLATLLMLILNTF